MKDQLVEKVDIQAVEKAWKYFVGIRLRLTYTNIHFNSGYLCRNPVPLTASTLLGAFCAKRIMRPCDRHGLSAILILRLNGYIIISENLLTKPEKSAIIKLTY